MAPVEGLRFRVSGAALRRALDKLPTAQAAAAVLDLDYDALTGPDPFANDRLRDNVKRCIADIAARIEHHDIYLLTGPQLYDLKLWRSS